MVNFMHQLGGVMMPIVWLNAGQHVTEKKLLCLKTATKRLNLGFQPASLPGGFQTQDYDTKCYLNIQSTNFSLASSHNHVSQAIYLPTYLPIYLCNWFCFSGKLMKTNTDSVLGTVLASEDLDKLLDEMPFLHCKRNMLIEKLDLNVRQWHPTPVLLPRKSHGQRSLVGCSPWGRQSRTRPSDFAFTFHFPALEKEMATHSSVLAWRIPGTGEPGELLSMGSHRVGHD